MDGLRRRARQGGVRAACAALPRARGNARRAAPGRGSRAAASCRAEEHAPAGTTLCPKPAYGPSARVAIFRKPGEENSCAPWVALFAMGSAGSALRSDRKSAVEGKRGSGGVRVGGRRTIKKKKRK